MNTLGGGLVPRLLRRLRAARKGSASVEFVMIFPLYLAVLFGGVEAGLLMMRKVAMESAVDKTVRELRLGMIDNPTHDRIKERICSHAMLMNNCFADIRIEMTVVNRIAWSMPADDAPCRDRTIPDELQPVVSVTPGVPGDPVIMRVCMVVDPLLPTSPLGLALPRDESGGFRMSAVTSFVNQP